MKVFFAFRDAPERRAALRSPDSLDRYRLFGLDETVRRGVQVRHNLERDGSPTRWSRATRRTVNGAPRCSGGYRRRLRDDPRLAQRDQRRRRRVLHSGYRRDAAHAAQACPPGAPAARLHGDRTARAARAATERARATAVQERAALDAHGHRILCGRSRAAAGMDRIRRAAGGVRTVRSRPRPVSPCRSRGGQR